MYLNLIHRKLFVLKFLELHQLSQDMLHIELFLIYNFPAEKVTRHQRHKLLICIKGKCARLYQRLLRCQEIHFSHQQQDCYQKHVLLTVLYVFHVLLTVPVLYSSCLAENLIGKV